MKKLIFPFLILVVVGVIVFFFYDNHSSSVSENAKLRIQENFGKIPLYFEKNEGQTADEIDFMSRGQGYGFYLKATESFFHISHDLLKMTLKGANEKANGSGLEEQKAKINYLTGNDPSKWKTGISTYAKVKYDQVYPGIDVVYYGNQKKLEYDFVVAPNADYSQIALKFDGAKNIKINETGDLVLTIEEGKELVQEKPKIYQEIDQEKKTIDGSYVLKGEGEVGFVVAAYDRTKPLVIDPVLEFSTYLGGSNWDHAIAVAVDSADNIIVAGDTGSSDFPTTVNAYQVAKAGSHDAFVSKLSADGQALIFSTYLGGSDWDAAFGVAVNLVGEIVVAGFTISSNFPTVNAYQVANAGFRDAFVGKFSPDGQTLLFSTYLGGSDDDRAYGVTVDSVNNIVVAGWSESTNFPTVNAYQGVMAGPGDAFVGKLSADGQALIFSTYLGGSDLDKALGVAVDSSGDIIVTGWTNSFDFPTELPYQGVMAGPGDAFVSKFSDNGQTLLFSTYLGGSGTDSVYGVTVNSTGEIIVAGDTASSDFPVQNAYQVANAGNDDVFIGKFSPDGQTLIFSTYLGGSYDDHANAVAVDSADNIVVVGFTLSLDFPMVNAYQGTFVGPNDPFISKFSADGKMLIFSTYLGGSSPDVASCVVIDSADNIVVVGGTASVDFPVVNAYQGSHGGGLTSSDSFIAKFSSQSITHAPDPPPEEVCDGIDNDHDGQIDEGFVWFGKDCVKVEIMSPEMHNKMNERFMQEDSKQKDPKKKELLKKKK